MYVVPNIMQPASNFFSFFPNCRLLTVTLQRSLKTVTTSSGLIVRKLKKTDTAIIDRLNRESVALGEKRGAEDLQCFVKSSQPGVSIAELDGDLVGSVAFHKVDDGYFTSGMYMVLEKYRGSGYGLSLVKSTIKEIDFTQIVSGYSTPAMVTFYEKFQYVPRWFGTKYALDLATGFQVLRAMPTVKGFTVTDIDHVDEEALLRYDATVFGYQRNRFISTWLNSEGNRVKVAVNANRDIVGYVVARPALMEQDAYYLAPLFSDSTEAAQALLTALFEEILLSHESSSLTGYIDCSNINTFSTGLIKLLCGKPIESYVFVSTHNIPRGHFNKWFGITCLQLG